MIKPPVGRGALRRGGSRALAVVAAAAAAALLAPQAASAAGAGSFSPTGSLPFPRSGAVAAPLPDGRVLVAGGVATLFNQTVFLSSALVFDPTTNGFSSAGIGDMGTARTGAAAAPLPDGRVLVAGGDNGSSVLASAEVFDPATNSFSPVGSMGTVRRGAAAATLGDGRVLVASGLGAQVERLASAEIFAASNAFSYRVRGKRLLVTVQASGTVEVKGEKGGSRAASARKRKKRSPLRPSSASGGPGTIAVPLRLGKAAKGKLRRKGKVRVRATITFSPQGGLANSQTAKLRIRAKSRKKDREKQR
jgi:Kelch motif